MEVVKALHSKCNKVYNGLRRKIMVGNEGMWMSLNFWAVVVLADWVILERVSKYSIVA